MKRTILYLAVTGMALIFCLSGCAQRGSNVTQDKTARAHLDITTGSITLPLSSYVASEADERLSSRAVELIVAPCMRAKGFMPRTGSETPDIPSEAQCNTDVGMAQRLGDLEASYQAPLIKQN